MQNLLKLDESNYYSQEANWDYCSVSQYKQFCGSNARRGCEARAMAELKGEWHQEVTKALLIGSILDDLWSGATSEDLIIKYPDCVSTRGSTKGELKAEFRQSVYSRSS